MNLQNHFLILLLLFLASCASSNYEMETIYPEKFSWEKIKGCHENGTNYKGKDAKVIFVCTITYRKGMEKLYPEWEEGKEYMALGTRDRLFQLEPIYEKIYAPDIMDYHFKPFNYILYRKKKGDFFTRYNTLTHTSELTPIDHLEPGKTYYGSPLVDKVQMHKRFYSGAFSDNMQTYYVLDNEFNILKKITNVDNNIERKYLFPPVHAFRTTHHISAKNETRMVRHNLNGRVYYQVYDFQGNKIGDEIPFKEVTYLFQRTSYNFDVPTYDVRPWVDKGDGVFMPIIHYGRDNFFDGTKDHGVFLGQLMLYDITKHHKGVFAGYYKPKDKKVFKRFPGSMVFKDAKGLYMTKDTFDFQAAAVGPGRRIEEFKNCTKDCYREAIELPFYSGALTYKGELVEDEIIVHRNLDESYSIKDSHFKAYKVVDVHPINSFSSIKNVEEVLFKIQKKLISRAKSRAEIKRKEREYQAELAAARARTDLIMADSRAARDQREKELGARIAIKDHNKKHEKPNPLFNLDLHKLLDTARAKRKAACFKKMSDSKKKYLSGSQGWYLQGKCN